MTEEVNNKKEEWKLPEETQEEKKEWQSIDLFSGYSPYEIAKRLKFGEGNNTIKIDNLYGLWTGNQTYALSPFRVSSRGTVERIILKNYAALPSTCSLGELTVSSTGSLYVCSATNVWTLVGRQN